MNSGCLLLHCSPKVLFFWCVCSELVPKWSAEFATKNADSWIAGCSLHSNLCLGGKHIFPCREGQRNIFTKYWVCLCVCEREAQNCFLSIPAGIHGPGIQTTATCLCDGPTALQFSLNIAPISSHLQTVDFSLLSHCLEVLLYNSWQNSPNLSQESAKLEKLCHYCLWISTKLLSTLYPQSVLEILNTLLSSTSLSPTINLLNIPCLKPYSIQNKNVVWNES